MRPAIAFMPVSGERSEFTDKLGQQYRWDGNPKRCPKKGERYLSGAAPVIAYVAPNDLSTEFFIAVPTKGTL